MATRRKTERWTRQSETVTYSRPDTEEQQYRAIFEASSDGMGITDAETGIVLGANLAFCRMHGYDQMVGMHPTAFIHPDSHHLFEEFARTVRAGGEFRCRAKDIRRDGSTFDVEVLGHSFTYRGKPAMLGVVRDVTAQVHGEQILEQCMELRTRELATLLEVSRNVSSTLGLQPLLKVILEQVRVVVNYDLSLTMTLTKDGFKLQFTSTAAESLKGRLSGRLVMPVDEEYDTARQVRNALADRHPSVIMRAANAIDVANAVRFARENDLPLAVRSGGHSFAGNSVADGAVVVDLSKMKGMSIDPSRQLARVQPGVTSGDRAGPANEFGLALSTGDVSSVGLGGLTLGGGIGWMVRKSTASLSITWSPPRSSPLRVLGGAMAQVPQDATAFAHRDRSYMFSIITEWDDPAEIEQHRAWTQATWRKLEPYGNGVYVNFLEDEGKKRVRQA